MAFLRQEGFQLLPLTSVRAHLDERRPFPERSAIVTFDDERPNGEEIGLSAEGNRELVVRLQAFAPQVVGAGPTAQQIAAACLAVLGADSVRSALWASGCSPFAEAPAAETQGATDAPAAETSGSPMQRAPAILELEGAPPPSIERIRTALEQGDTTRALRSSVQLSLSSSDARERDSSAMVAAWLHRARGRYNLASETFGRVSARNGPLSEYGGWLLLAIIVVLAAFFAFRGRIRTEAGPSGVRVTRFNGLERFAHWLTAVPFVILALTGLNMLYGRYVLKPLLGPRSSRPSPRRESTPTTTWPSRSCSASS